MSELKKEKVKIKVHDWFWEALKEIAETTEKAINNGMSVDKGKTAIEWYIEEVLFEAIEIVTPEGDDTNG